MIACKSTVSGSLSLPFRGSFHRSLTVLCAIGHWEYLALRGGPRGFSHRFTNNDLLRCHLRHPVVLLQDFHLLWSIFPDCSDGVDESLMVILQPREVNFSVWADPFSLAATDGIDFSFCSCGYLDVSVLRVPFSYEIPVMLVGFPIRTSQSQRLSPTRLGFSQVIASFIGSSARASTVDPYYLDLLSYLLYCSPEQLTIMTVLDERIASLSLFHSSAVMRLASTEAQKLYRHPDDLSTLKGA